MEPVGATDPAVFRFVAVQEIEANDWKVFER
jgi:hypothetical protein